MRWIAIGKELMKLGFQKKELGIHNTFYNLNINDIKIQILDITKQESLLSKKHRDFVTRPGIYINLQQNESNIYSDYFKKDEDKEILNAIYAYIIKSSHLSQELEVKSKAEEVCNLENLNIDLFSNSDLDLQDIFQSFSESLNEKTTQEVINKKTEFENKKNYPKYTKDRKPIIGNFM